MKLGMFEQVRKSIEWVNRRVYRANKVLHLYDTASAAQNLKTNTSRK